jgi:hypothetical protein
MKRKIFFRGPRAGDKIYNTAHVSVRGDDLFPNPAVLGRPWAGSPGVVIIPNDLVIGDTYTNIFFSSLELLSVHARPKVKLQRSLEMPSPLREISNCDKNVVFSLKITHHIFHKLDGMHFQGDWWRGSTSGE